MRNYCKKSFETLRKKWLLIKMDKKKSMRNI